MEEEKGFTLVELIVCIAIVGILASAILVILSKENISEEVGEIKMSREDKCYEAGGFPRTTAWGHECVPPNKLTPKNQ